jgi:hypothetical protein
MRERIYGAWETARADIYNQWQEQTDPLNIQPDIQRLFREVGQHLRDHWPDDMTQETVEAVEAPWGQRYERELREIYEDDSLGPVEKSRRLIEKVDDRGFQSFEVPDPLPPLEVKKEVKLVCWLIVAPTEEERRETNQSGLLSQVSVDSFES